MTKIIAEIGQAHDGSLGTLYAYINALADTGVDTIKFQVHIADAESSIYEPFRVHFSKQDNTRFDYWKRMEFTKDEWKAIKSYCEEKELEFLASPFSNAAVDLLEDIDVNCYKIGSGEVSNYLLLEKIVNTGKPMILSSGMSSFEELDATVNFLTSKDVKFSVLQCTTAYPASPKEYGLNVIQELRNRYHVPVGFSDHSAKKETLIAAVTLGAEIIEFHAVFNRDMFGPDCSSSLTIDEIKELVIAVRTIEIALANPVNKNSNEQFKTVKQIFEKSLAVNKDLKAGHIITFSDLEAKKPKGYGIAASKFENVIGKKLRNDLNQWDFLNQININN